MGYNKDRGDSLNVVNTQFSTDMEPEVPLWKQPGMIELAKKSASTCWWLRSCCSSTSACCAPSSGSCPAAKSANAWPRKKAEAEAAAAAAAVAAGFDPDDPDAIVNLSGEPAGGRTRSLQGQPGNRQAVGQE
jgi:flagellar M-ring protein FliF